MHHTHKNHRINHPPRGPIMSRGEAVGRGAVAPLGTNGGIVGRSAAKTMGGSQSKQEDRPFYWQEKRRALWTLSRTAARLIYPEGTLPKNIKGVGTCRWAVRSNANGVDVRMSRYAETDQTRASYDGLQTCGLVWQCPACAARISETRRKQVNIGLEWAKSQGYQIQFITLTARHGKTDRLRDLLLGMKNAKRAFHQHRRWKAIKNDLVVPLTATEVTNGVRNGWHPHFHMIVIVKTEAAKRALTEMGDAWRGSLRGQNLDGKEAAFHCQDASEAGHYISKWGAGEELTLSGKKNAKGKGRTPLQLLEAYQAGNADAGALWLEYVDAFYRRTQLDGLSKLVRLSGQNDLTDAEAAQDEAQDGQEQDEAPLLNISTLTWKTRGRHRRTDILDAAERSGADGVRRVLDGDDDTELIE